ncbi:hypothetical protein [Ancylobacter sp. G4_0304]|uniref:hypothetical protein n=1 Tax=Ancylobacter sp. G4_0304 TaxID=3114289 RepID=UPI0039C6F1EA
MAETDRAPAGGVRGRFPLGRVRAGILVLVALALISAMAGRWLATVLSLGFGWAAGIGIAVALIVPLVLSRLDRLAYFIVAGLVTLAVAYLVYDFSRGPVDLSPEWGALLALVPAVLLAAAFWDFRTLMIEVRAWAARRL